MFLRARGETDIIFPSEGKVSSSSLDERTTFKGEFIMASVIIPVLLCILTRARCRDSFFTIRSTKRARLLIAISFAVLIVGRRHCVIFAPIRLLSYPRIYDRISIQQAMQDMVRNAAAQGVSAGQGLIFLELSVEARADGALALWGRRCLSGCCEKSNTGRTS